MLRPGPKPTRASSSDSLATAAARLDLGTEFNTHEELQCYTCAEVKMNLRLRSSEDGTRRRAGPSSDAGSGSGSSSSDDDSDVAKKAAPAAITVDMLDVCDSAQGGGCLFCVLVYNSLMEAGVNISIHEEYYPLQIVAKEGRPIYVSWASSESRGNIEIYQTQDSPMITNLGTAIDIPGDIDDSEVFEQITLWIEQCQFAHPDCPQGSNYPPKRLVDIANPELERGILCLVEGKREPVKYLALSHCWGSSQPFTTTKSNLNERIAGFRFDSLPQTFQDAIVVANELGIRYLWIDSLCIIQDDVIDWQTESSKMAEIYEDSWVTLAVANAYSDAVGFLEAPERQNYHSRDVEFEFRDTVISGVRVRTVHDYRTASPLDVLSTRAWTLQERLMPPRLLTFAACVSMECRGDAWCECGSGIYPDPFCGGAAFYNLLDRDEVTQVLQSAEDPNRAYNHWMHEVIRPYTMRKITKDSDRLPALAALASRFAMLLDDTYLAGLWLRDLHRGLSWCSQFQSRPCRSSAPSWSWASIEADIVFGTWPIPDVFHKYEEPTLQCDLLEYDMDFKGAQGAFGEINHGRLTLNAGVVDCVLQFNNKEHLKKAATFRKYTLRPNSFAEQYVERAIIGGPNSQNGAMFHPDCNMRTPNGDRTYLTRVSTDDSSYDDVEVSGDVKCVFLFETSINEFRPGRFREFIVLGQHPAYPGAYQRLGLVTIQCPSGQEATAWFGDLETQMVEIY